MLQFGESDLKRGVLVCEGIIRGESVCVCVCVHLSCRTVGGSSSLNTELLFARVKPEPGSHTECYSHLLDKRGTQTHPHSFCVFVNVCVCVCASNFTGRQN